MSEDGPTDPFRMARDLVTQWEKLVNEHGTKLLARPEFARLQAKATDAGVRAQAATHEAMARALALANMPSKADIEALGARLANIEATLAQIAAQLRAREPAGASAGSAPKRTRKPPR